MRAVLCKRYGLPESLVVEDVPPLKAGKGEVVVHVRASGVNFPDVLIIQNKHHHKPGLPFSPGSDIAGVVKEVGESVDGFRPGDPVIGLLSWGGFAEEVAVPAARLIPISSALDFKVAAAFGLTYTTTYYALKDCARLTAGETLLVLGAAGGVGTAAVELGRLMGARVIACASSTEKLDVCRRSGADEIINYETGDLREDIRCLTDGRGVDVVYDPVGGKYAEPSVRSMAWKGRYLVVGFASGEIPKIPLNLVLLKGCSLIGVRRGQFMLREPNASSTNIRELVAWLTAGNLRPLVSRTYPLARAAEALNDVMNRKALGKVVLVT